MALSGLGVVRSRRRLTRTSALSRAAARQRRGGATVGLGRRRGVGQRRCHHSFERVGHSGRWTRLERWGEVSRPGRGTRYRRHRAAWRLIRNGVASSQLSSRARAHSSMRVTRSFAGNGRSGSRLTVRVSPPWASPRAASGCSTVVSLASTSRKEGSF